MEQEKKYTFDLLGLKSKVVKVLNENLISTPTPIQKRVIPAALENKNVVGIARTGTGKTLSFILPILDEWITNKEKEYIIVCPSKELAFQLKQETDKYGASFGITTALVTGGMKEKSIRNIAKKSPNIIIANPGMLKQLHLKQHINFKNLSTIVLDEVDQIVEKSMLEAMEYIFSHIPSKVQKMFFSATIPKKIKNTINDFAKDLVWIEVQKHVSNKLNINEKVYYTKPEEKKDLVFHLLYENLNTKTILFFSDRILAREYYQELKKADFKAEFIHGKKETNTRINFINKFRNNEFNILVTTDVLGRGIDITDVELIINVEVPDTKELYEHRIGRTGRLGRKGTAITCCTKGELKNYRQIEKLHKEVIKEVFSHPFAIPMPTTVEKTKLRNKGLDGSNAHRKAWNNLIGGKK